jgi:L-ascorbate metabolism protein UlaG (beta-lactamase superfamily)
MPGRSIELTKMNKKVTITATKGALVGPPWQATENGYIIRPDIGASFYYEPHCMYDEQELAQYTVDYVISPIVSQELPFFTLVAGGEKAKKLAQILKAKAIIPMANGELNQSGVLALLVRSGGTEKEFLSMMKRSSSSSSQSTIDVLKVIPGESIYLLA